MGKTNRSWIIALAIGAVSGLVLAAGLNLFSPTRAEFGAKQDLDAQALENDFVAVAQAVGPGVVSISTEQTYKTGRQFEYYGNREFDHYFEQFFRDFLGDVPQREYKHRGLGSGFIIDKAGYILTNQHVIEEADKITVTLPDGRKFNAEVKGSDARSDLAVIKIEAGDLPVLRLGDSDKVRIGQWAIAVGNPYGYIVGSAEPTVTAGIVSALSRSLPTMFEQRSYIDLIQTDAAINPGNSGGPLVNIKGEVIGINVAIFTPTGGNIGIGFAIPINVAKDALDRLIAGKKVQYGWLGVSIQDLSEELAEHFKILDQKGALVVKVLPGSPGEKGGIQEGDVIISFDGESVSNMRSLLRLAGRAEIGKKVTLDVIRNGAPDSLTVTIGERPDEAEVASQVSGKSWRGMQVNDITEELAAQYRISLREGVIVTAVEARSPAYNAGIRPGDVITSVARRRVKNSAEFEALTSNISGAVIILTDRGFAVIKE